MNILGIAFLDDASAAVVRDGKLVSAVSEERLNRIKLWHGVPQKAIETALELAGITLADIDVIATHGKAPPLPDSTPYEEKAEIIRHADLPEEQKRRQLDALETRREHESKVLAERTPAYLEKIRELGIPVLTYGHHNAHAAVAYYGCGWDECLVLTADGWGEDGSSSLWSCSDHRMELAGRSNTFDSLGYFYGSITKSLGFIPHRHEGKVLGLAAYCDDPKSYPTIRSMIDYDPGKNRFIGRMERGGYMPQFDNPALDDFVNRFDRTDIAAATQRTLEEVVCQLITEQGGAGNRCALAGGVFANVKLNQRIAELENVEEVFVFPNMGDGGLSIGAAWLAHMEKTGQAPEPLKTMYLGPVPKDREIEAELAKSGLKYKREEDVQGSIAALLAAGEVVARCVGRMEFGPRALGHRSILCNATDPSINKWLNKRLGRTEFMPFAPVVLEDAAQDLFYGLDGSRIASKYMTITLNSTAKMRKEAPAAVHVDGTARPQLVCQEAHPDLHGILKSYREKTGLSCLINTSFNMHEEPIVCSAQDAVRAFVASGLPYLAVGDFIVSSGSDLKDGSPPEIQLPSK